MNPLKCEKGKVHWTFLRNDIWMGWREMSCHKCQGQFSRKGNRKQNIIFGPGYLDKKYVK
jgi:hypothetical protein